MGLVRPGAAPAAGHRRGKAPAAIIVHVPDQDLRKRAPAIGGKPRVLGDHRAYQPDAEAFALPFRHHGDRPDHHQRHLPLRSLERHRPALDRGDQHVVLVERGKAQARQPVHAFADAIGGARVAIRPEGTIEHFLDHGGIDRLERDQAGSGGSGHQRAVSFSSLPSLPSSAIQIAPSGPCAIERSLADIS